jgi:hypothetical protein
LSINVNAEIEITPIVIFICFPPPVKLSDHESYDDQ